MDSTWDGDIGIDLDNIKSEIESSIVKYTERVEKDEDPFMGVTSTTFKIGLDKNNNEVYSSRQTLNKETKWVKYYDNGQVEAQLVESETSKTYKEYQKNGAKKLEVYKGLGGISEERYNIDGNILIRKSLTDGYLGEEITIDKYTYNDEGLLVKKVTMTDGDLEETILNTYDDNGRLLQSITKDAENVDAKIVTNKYDDKGNLIYKRIDDREGVYLGYDGSVKEEWWEYDGSGKLIYNAVREITDLGDFAHFIDLLADHKPKEILLDKR